jgi:hypothetical protein
MDYVKRSCRGCMSQGNAPTTLLCLLHLPIDAKGDALATQIAIPSTSPSPGMGGDEEEIHTPSAAHYPIRSPCNYYLLHFP